MVERKGLTDIEVVVKEILEGKIEMELLSELETTEEDELDT